MATSRPFAYNTGSTISGTEQIGNLAIGVPTNGFDSTGLQWFNGPDEDLGYVIAYEQINNAQPTPNGGFAGVQFWRSKLLTNQDFLNLCNSVIKTQTFNDVTVAKNYLNNNGYWTSFEIVTPTPSVTPTITTTSTPTPTVTPTSNIVTSGLIIQLDAYSNVSYPGSGSTIYDLTNSYNHTMTSAPYTVLNGIKCFDCNGTSNTIIEVNGTGPTLPTSGYTYITWGRVKTSSASWRTMFRTLPNDHPLLVQIGTDNLGFYDNDGISFIDSGYDVTSIEDVWVQYAVVGDNVSSTFYINGTQVGTTAYGAGGNRHWAWGSINGQPFGYVANMYLYDRKLTLSEITQQYNFLSPRFVEVSPTPSVTPTQTVTPTITPTNTVTPSSTPAAPVSSGLELYYDPSNLSSYPGSGTTLFDLSSSAVNATIGGSPTYSSNAFTFAGSQSIITGNLSGLFAGWQHSLEIWFNASAIGGVFSDTGTGPTNTSYHATGLEVYSAGPFYLTNAMLWKAVTGGVTRVGGGTVSLNTWYQLVRVYNGSNLAYAYLNKVKSSDTSITWGTPTPGWYLNFGSSETTNFATGAAFQGKIGVVRLYNRVLSLEEVTQNFNADKSKYGL